VAEGGIMEGEEATTPLVRILLVEAAADISAE
jgi:hypothetical protein